MPISLATLSSQSVTSASSYVPALAETVTALTAGQCAAPRQRTLRHTAVCSGIATHSGNQASLKLLPAPTDTGIVFIRTDLKNGARAFAARWDQVVDTRMCTVLGNQAGEKLATVEHLMAALHAYGIDNALIEIDGAEVPIMDGSSAAFVALIESAGVEVQNAPRREIEILKPVELVVGTKQSRLLPGTDSRYSVEILFDRAPIYRQQYSVTLSPETFKAEIASARTFGFAEEVEQLRAMGLARGSSLANAIGIKDGAVMNLEGLRYADEFARHKLLDAIGDLALAGAAIRGSFEGFCCGHAMNNQLLRTLFADSSAWRYIETETSASLSI